MGVISHIPMVRIVIGIGLLRSQSNSCLSQFKYKIWWLKVTGIIKKSGCKLYLFYCSFCIRYSTTKWHSTSLDSCGALGGSSRWYKSWVTPVWLESSTNSFKYVRRARPDSTEWHINFILPFLLHAQLIGLVLILILMAGHYDVSTGLYRLRIDAFLMTMTVFTFVLTSALLLMCTIMGSTELPNSILVVTFLYKTFLPSNYREISE